MLTQTLAIFHDAYRELNAKKMFWIVLILSALVVLAFAAVGVENRSLTVFGKNLPVPIPMDKAEFYRLLFTSFGIGVWLSVAATVLALISTASLFPDFITGGSIDLYLSKPIGRLRLFLTKYAAGLLFVALQVLVFSGACFLVIGLRGGAWETRIFLAVPIVVCFFSYLYCVSVLVGVVTRSTIAAILLTVLAWGLMFLVGASETTVLLFKTAADRQARTVEPALKVVNAQIAGIERQPAAERSEASASRLANLQAQRGDLESQAAGTARRNLTIAHDILYGVKTALPKTSETIALLNRWLLSDETLGTKVEVNDGGGGGGGRGGATRPGRPNTRPRRDQPFEHEDAVAVDQTIYTRPVSWVIGTSLGFEAVVLAAAAWVFCRRDY